MIAIVAYGTIVALYLVLVAIGVASTSVKAATCKRGKKLAYNDPFVAVAKSYTRREQNASKPSSAR